MEPASFCCLRCRLLQPRAQQCVECESPHVAAVEREIFAYRDLDVGAKSAQTTTGEMRFLGNALVGAGAIVATSIAIPMLAPVLIGGAAVAAIALARRPKLAAVDGWPIVVARDAVQRTGIARPIGSTITSVIDGAPAIAEHVVVHRRRGVLVRRTLVAAPGFLVELDDGGKLGVAGVLRLDQAEHQLGSIGPKHPVLAALGIPASFGLRGKLAVATIRDGDRVVVRGVPAAEIVPELAFHREGGNLEVMRGAASGVVVVNTDNVGR